MQALHSVPFLSRLPRVELAKLVSDLHTLEVPKGEMLSPAGAETSYVYFIQSGKVGVYLEMAETPVTLMIMCAGEVFGEGAYEEGLGANRYAYRAIEDAVLYRLERSRFESILSQHPALLQQFGEAMVKRSYLVLDELAKAKNALLVHAAEVWSLVEDEALMAHAEAEVAAAENAVSVPEAGEKPTSAPRWSWRPVVHYVLPVLAALLVLVAGGTDFTFSSPRAFLALLVWGVTSWLFDAMPDYVVALAMALGAGIVGIVSLEMTLSGFSNKNWFLLLSVIGISAGIARTGLLYRIALHMLRLFPPTYNGQSTALALVGLVLAPFIPGIVGRQAMASRLSVELGEAMGFKPHSKGSSGLAMACFVGFSCVYYISLTGASSTLLVWSILPAAVQKNLSWSAWFIAAIPMALIVFALTLISVLKLYKPEEKVNVTRDVVDSQLRVLGPMNHQEWITVWVVAAIVVAFVTQPFHGIDPTWFALPGFLFLGATGIVDKDVLRKGMDWGFLLLTGGLFAIVSITSESGIVSMLSNAIVPFIRPLSGNPWLFVTAVAVLTAVIHLAVPTQPTILLAALAMAPVAAELGYNPFVVGLIVLVMASHFVIPHGNPMYMAAYGGSEQRAFTHKQIRKLALIHAGITLVGVWASIPFWQWLGLL